MLLIFSMDYNTPDGLDGKWVIQNLKDRPVTAPGET